MRAFGLFVMLFGEVLSVLTLVRKYRRAVNWRPRRSCVFRVCCCGWGCWGVCVLCVGVCGVCCCRVLCYVLVFLGVDGKRMALLRAWSVVCSLCRTREVVGHFASHFRTNYSPVHLVLMYSWAKALPKDLEPAKSFGVL